MTHPFLFYIERVTKCGYSLEEAAQLAESTSVLLNVSEFQSIDDATSALVSTMQAFGYAAEDSMHVVDVMNEIGNNYAVSSDGIATALQDSASSLMAANNSYQEAVALIASANKVVQDPNSVGSALRTISLRLRGTSTTDLENAGEETDGAITSKSKLRSKIKGLSGIDILTDSGAYKSTYEILLEISKVWDDMTDMNRAGLLEIIAGKTRSNTAAAILSNSEDLQNAYQDAMDAEGSALRENEKYLSSIQGRIDLFTNAVQTMWQNTLDDSVIKWFVDLGTNIVKTVNTLGLIPSILAAIGVSKGIKAVFGVFKDSGITIAGLSKQLWTYISGVQATTVAEKVLTQVQLTKKLTTQGLTEENAKAIIAETGLGVSTDKLTKETLEASMATLGYSEAQIQATSAKIFGKTATDNLTVADRLFRTELVKSLATQYLTTEATKALELAKYNLKLAEMGLLNGIATTADVQAAQAAVEAASIPVDISKISTTELLGLAFKQLAINIWGAIKAITTFLFTNPVGQIILATGAFFGIVAIINSVAKSTEELKEELDSLKSELSDIKSELNSLNSELETTQSRMAELLAMPSLSFTEEEELKALQKQNDELEREIYLLEQRQKRKQKEAENTFNDLMDDEFKNGTSQLGVGTGLTEKVILESHMDLYQKQVEELNQAKDDLVKAEESGNEKEIKKAEKKVKEKEKNVERTRKYIDDKIKEYTDAADGIDYDLADDKTKEYLDYINNLEDRFNIISGDAQAKSVAIKRIFNKSEFSGAKEAIDDLIKQLNEGADASAINGQIQSIINNTKGLSDELKEVGLNAKIVADSFTMISDSTEYMDVDQVIEKTAQTTLKLQDVLYEITGQEWKEQLDGFEKVKKEVEKYKVDLSKTKYGNVDLNNKKRRIDWTKENKEKYKEPLLSYGINTDDFVEGDYSTVLGTAKIYNDKSLDKNRAIEIAFTPIMVGEDGKIDVLSQDNVDNYISGILEKAYENGKYDKEKILELDTRGIIAGIGHDDAKAAATGMHYAGIYGAYNDEKARAEEAKKEMEDALKIDDIFDDQGKVIQTKLSKIFNDTSETTRKNITSILESNYDKIKKGTVNINNLLTEFALKSQQEILKVSNDILAQQNQELFPNLKDEISGIIDNFDELSKAVGNVVDAMDLLDKARKEEAYSGSISLETLSQLMQYTGDYADLVSIDETGAIHLAANAQEILIQTKLDAIKANAEQAYQEALVTYELAVQKAEASKAGNALYNGYLTVVDEAAGALAYVGTIAGAVWDAIKGNGWAGWSNVLANASNARSSTIKSRNTARENSVSDAAAALEKAENNRKIANGLTTDNVKKRYSADEASGKNDKDKDSDKDKKTAKDLFDELAAEYDRQISTLEYKKDLIQSEIDKAEARGEVASESFYQRQIELEEQNRQALINKKKALEDYLKAQGKNMTKEEWADAQEEINNTALAIKDCEQNVIDLGQAIDDVHWEYFDKFTSDVDDLGDENSTMLSLVGDTDDAVDENGNWTASGVTQIGLNAQEMQRNLEMANQMQKEKDNIQKSWNAYQRVLAKHGGDADKVTEKEKKKIQDKYDGVLITSEGEYQERMQDVTQTQRDYAKAAKDSKDAIEDLAKARVDKEVEAIEEQIDAYKELIDLKKEELEAERDLYEFKKDVENQTKNITSLERRIASLSGSTDAADVAELRKLQGELADAKTGLNDTYYSHAKDAQQDALDKEAESYEKSQRDKIKILEDTLEDAEALITNAIMDMLLNADVVLQTLNDTANEYGVTLSDELTAPWEAASIEAENYKKWLQANISNGVLAGVTDESGVITLFSNDLDKKINGPWKNAKNAVDKYVTYMNSKSVKNLPGLFTSWQSTIQGIANKWDSVKKAAEKAAKAQIDAANVKVPNNQGSPNSGGGSDSGSGSGGGGSGGGSYAPPTASVMALQEVLNSVINAGLTPNGTYNDATKGAVKKIQRIQGLTEDGYYGPKTRNGLLDYIDSEIKKYRSGTQNSYSLNAMDRLSDAKKKVPAAFYAKGTRGIKKDEWAIDSEPQHGDELVLVPGKGVLSYMRKGTSVIPADLTNNLMDWGQLNPNDLNASNNVNLVSNNVSESEVKLNLGVDGLTNGNVSGLGKDVTDYIENLSGSIQDTDKLIKETTKGTIEDSTNAIETIFNLADKNKSPLSTSLTSPWIDTIKKSKDFETAAKLNYNKILKHVDQYKGSLESVLGKPYKDLTGDKNGNEVYEFLEYAKKTSIDKIISYANSKASSIDTSLSKGFDDAKSSTSEFSKSGSTAIDTLKDKFTNSKTGLIKALNDTTQAAKDAKKAIENVPGYGGSGGIGGLVVPSGGLSSSYGYRHDPKTGKVKLHGGNDYGAPMGARINAARSGVVSTVGWMPNGYGKYVIIDHGNGIQTLYGHTSEILVKEGQQVTIGQQIAKVGSTGYSTGPHVHFEYRNNGKRLNPETLPKFAKGTTGTKKDQWAVTDEPNFGDELTMYATPEGKLSFMRVGSTVVPADLTKELMDIADIGVDNLTMPKLNSDINLMSNYISKPELNISFDSMVHVDNCSQDTLKDLEKMVDSKINTFSRQLNYSLKRFSK